MPRAGEKNPKDSTATTPDLLAHHAKYRDYLTSFPFGQKDAKSDATRTSVRPHTVEDPQVERSLVRVNSKTDEGDLSSVSIKYREKKKEAPKKENPAPMDVNARFKLYPK